MNDDIAISVRDLTKTFHLREEKRSTLKERFVKGASKPTGTFTALDSVSFDVPRGTTFGLVGHNGSGKSTLLKILAGVYRPTSGDVRVNGHVSALLELGAGFHGELTGRENIRLNGAILGMSRKKIRESMDEIIDFAELGRFIDVPVKNYSSGMYVRLGFAIAVMLDPDILIVDEVIAVGDEAFQRKSFDHMYELRQRGTTIALVTHSMELAQELCDQALWLDGGVVQVQGSITDVVAGYVKDVNRREKLRLTSDQQETRLSRRGSGEVTVTAAGWADRKGTPAPFATTDEPFCLGLTVAAEKPIRGVGITVRVYQENGVLLGAINSSADGVDFDFEQGENRVRFELDQVVLQPGTYWASTSLRSHGHAFDEVDKGWRLVVRGDGAIDTLGAIRIAGSWHATEPPVLQAEKKTSGDTNGNG